LDSITITDELVNLIFKKENEESEAKVINQHILDHINNHRIIPQEIYDCLLNNQKNLNSIYLLAYFNYHGIGTSVNKQKAFELYQKAADLGNSNALDNLANCPEPKA
jgi:TPR repeat protein